MDSTDNKMSMVITNSDRPLYIINDATIRGATRLQKYGFLLAKQYEPEMRALAAKHGISFYADWEPRQFGPYSESLAEDVRECMVEGLVQRTVDSTANKHNVYIFNLTIRGRARWRKLFLRVREISHFAIKVRSMQDYGYYTLIDNIYTAYPEFAVNSTIRDQINQNA